MPRIQVLVATAVADVKAAVIAESVKSRPDMTLVEPRVEPAAPDRLTLTVAEVEAFVEQLPASAQCAVVVIGPHQETEPPARRWLAKRADLVVVLLEIVGDAVRITMRDPRLDEMLSAVRDLVGHLSVRGAERMAHVQFRPGEGGVPPGGPIEGSEGGGPRPLLRTAIRWIHGLLRDAVALIPDQNGDLTGLTVTRTTLLQSLDTSPEEARPGMRELEEQLDRVRAEESRGTDPLAIATEVFELDPLEFRLMLLALAPELDLRFQRCIGFLLDEMGRRVGTLGLYSALLGATGRERFTAVAAGSLADWMVFEGALGHQAYADEPLHVDPFLARWLLGERSALPHDPRVRRVLRLTPWSGAEVLERPQERDQADRLLNRLDVQQAAAWVLLAGDDPTGWRAVLELGAAMRKVQPLRVEGTSVAELDILEAEDAGRRVGRAAWLTRLPLVIDVSDVEPWAGSGEGATESLPVFLAAARSTGCPAAVICRHESHGAHLLAGAQYDLINAAPIPLPGRVAAMRTAADGADLYLGEDAAQSLVQQFPVHVDGLEHAMLLARSRPLRFTGDDPRLTRFLEACREVAAEGVSHLADRLDPIFRLEDVILPADRKDQLFEIVNHVRLAPRVLDDWKFGEQLPYGRGVSALFHGPSGTGKTMAALAIARRLGVQILRLDLSRVESKYIGDTPKNVDRVFSDGERSGATILIDEADALLGKRSEVKDAHDRWANIEVAYILQRMEAYQGLAILTTNQRQNLDPAFLRRLRFIVEFPRPDVEAREQIWRRCLPAACHALDDTAFRHLARRIDLTGGHIRQITLRAAFLAAASDTRVTLGHLAHAARYELAKIGMPPVDLDVAVQGRAA